MCSIIGAINISGFEGFDKHELRLFEELFKQSRIRGLHATGLSYLEEEKVVTIKDSLSAEEFLEKYPLDFLLGKEVFIGHCRYSTSDLEYNQPIADEELSIVHNGVVTQEDPSHWEDKFGYKFITKNDSEIFFRKLKEGKQPFLDLPEASGAVLTLKNNGDLKVFRNGKRPLWKVEYNNRLIFASTKDIIIRSFKNTGNFYSNLERIDLGVVYKYNTFSKHNTFHKTREFEGIDWQ